MLFVTEMHGFRMAMVHGGYYSRQGVNAINKCSAYRPTIRLTTILGRDVAGAPSDHYVS